MIPSDMDEWITGAWLLAGLAVPAAAALAPVRVWVRWRGAVRTAGHLACRAQLRYLLLQVRARGALVATLSPAAAAAARLSMLPAIGPMRLAPRSLTRRWPGPSEPAAGGQQAGARRPWKQVAARALVRRLKRRLVVPRLELSARWGARDAMAAALGAASAQILVALAVARLLPLLTRGSPGPRVVVRPAIAGQASLEARGELMAQVPAWVVVFAAAGAALAAMRAALRRRQPSPGGAQRASAQSAAA